MKARRTKKPVRPQGGFADLMSAPPGPSNTAGVITGVARSPRSPQIAPLSPQQTSLSPTQHPFSPPRQPQHTSPRHVPPKDDWESLLSVQPKRRVSPRKSLLSKSTSFTRARRNSSSQNSSNPRDTASLPSSRASSFSQSNLDPTFNSVSVSIPPTSSVPVEPITDMGELSKKNLPKISQSSEFTSDSGLASEGNNVSRNPELADASAEKGSDFTLNVEPVQSTTVEQGIAPVSSPELPQSTLSVEKSTSVPVSNPIEPIPPVEKIAVTSSSASVEVGCKSSDPASRKDLDLSATENHSSHTSSIPSVEASAAPASAIPSFLSGWDGAEGWGDEPSDDSDPDEDEDDAWDTWALPKTNLTPIASLATLPSSSQQPSHTKSASLPSEARNPDSPTGSRSTKSIVTKSPIGMTHDSPNIEDVQHLDLSNSTTNQPLFTEQSTLPTAANEMSQNIPLEHPQASFSHSNFSPKPTPSKSVNRTSTLSSDFVEETNFQQGTEADGQPVRTSELAFEASSPRNKGGSAINMRNVGATSQLASTDQQVTYSPSATKQDIKNESMLPHDHVIENLQQPSSCVIEETKSEPVMQHVEQSSSEWAQNTREKSGHLETEDGLDSSDPWGVKSEEGWEWGDSAEQKANASVFDVAFGVQESPDTLVLEKNLSLTGAEKTDEVPLINSLSPARIEGLSKPVAKDEAPLNAHSTETSITISPAPKMTEEQAKENSVSKLATTNSPTVEASGPKFESDVWGFGEVPVHQGVHDDFFNSCPRREEVASFSSTALPSASSDAAAAISKSVAEATLQSSCSKLDAVDVNSKSSLGTPVVNMKPFQGPDVTVTADLKNSEQLHRTTGNDLALSGFQTAGLNNIEKTGFEREPDSWDVEGLTTDAGPSFTVAGPDGDGWSVDVRETPRVKDEAAFNALEGIKPMASFVSANCENDIQIKVEVNNACTNEGPPRSQDPKSFTDLAEIGRKFRNDSEKSMDDFQNEHFEQQRSVPTSFKQTSQHPSTSRSAEEKTDESSVVPIAEPKHGNLDSANTPSQKSLPMGSVASEFEYSASDFHKSAPTSALGVDNLDNQSSDFHEPGEHIDKTANSQDMKNDPWAPELEPQSLSTHVWTSAGPMGSSLEPNVKVPQGFTQPMKKASESAKTINDSNSEVGQAGEDGNDYDPFAESIPSDGLDVPEQEAAKEQSWYDNDGWPAEDGPGAFVDDSSTQTWVSQNMSLSSVPTSILQSRTPVYQNSEVAISTGVEQQNIERSTPHFLTPTTLSSLKNQNNTSSFDKSNAIAVPGDELINSSHNTHQSSMSFSHDHVFTSLKEHADNGEESFMPPSSMTAPASSMNDSGYEKDKSDKEWFQSQTDVLGEGQCDAFKTGHPFNFKVDSLPNLEKSDSATESSAHMEGSKDVWAQERYEGERSQKKVDPSIDSHSKHGVDHIEDGYDPFAENDVPPHFDSQAFTWAEQVSDLSSKTSQPLPTTFHSNNQSVVDAFRVEPPTKVEAHIFSDSHALSSNLYGSQALQTSSDTPDNESSKVLSINHAGRPPVASSTVAPHDLDKAIENHSQFETKQELNVREKNQYDQQLPSGSGDGPSNLQPLLEEIDESVIGQSMSPLHQADEARTEQVQMSCSHSPSVHTQSPSSQISAEMTVSSNPEPRRMSQSRQSASTPVQTLPPPFPSVFVPIQDNVPLRIPPHPQMQGFSQQQLPQQVVPSGSESYQEFPVVQSQESIQSSEDVNNAGDVANTTTQDRQSEYANVFTNYVPDRVSDAKNVPPSPEPRALSQTVSGFQNPSSLDSTASRNDFVNGAYRQNLEPPGFSPYHSYREFSYPPAPPFTSAPNLAFVSPPLPNYDSGDGYSYSIMDTGVSSEIDMWSPHAVISWGFGGLFAIALPPYAERTQPGLRGKTKVPSLHNVKLMDLQDIGTDLSDDDIVATREAIHPVPLPAHFSDLNRYSEMCDRLSKLSVGFSGSVAEGRSALWRLLALMCRNSGADWKSSAGAAICGPSAVKMFNRGGGISALSSTAIQDSPLLVNTASGSTGEKQMETAAEVENLVTQGKKLEAIHMAEDSELWSIALILAACESRDMQLNVISDYCRASLKNGSALQTFCYAVAGNYAEIAKTATSAGLKEWRKTIGIMLSSEESSSRSNSDAEQYMNIIEQVGDALLSDKKDIVAAHICYILAGRLRILDGERFVLLGADSMAPPGRPRSFGSAAVVLQSLVFELACSAKGLGPFPHLIPFRLILCGEIAALGRPDVALMHCESAISSVKAIFDAGRNDIASSTFTPPFLASLELLEMRLRGHLSVSEERKRQGTVGALGRSLSSLLNKAQITRKSNPSLPQKEVPIFSEHSSSQASIPEATFRDISKQQQPVSVESQTLGPEKQVSVSQPAAVPVQNPGQRAWGSTSMSALEPQGSSRKDVSNNERLMSFVSKTVKILAPGGDLSPPPRIRDQPNLNGGAERASSFGLNGQTGSRMAGASMAPGGMRPSASAGNMPDMSHTADQINFPPETRDGKMPRAMSEDEMRRLGFGGFSEQEKLNKLDSRNTPRNDAPSNEGVSDKKPPKLPKRPGVSNSDASVTATSQNPPGGWRVRLAERLMSTFGGPKRAHMGKKNEFVYDKEKGRWIIPGEDENAEALDSLAPPPDDSELSSQGHELTEVKESTSFDDTIGHRESHSSAARSHSAENLMSRPSETSMSYGTRYPEEPSFYNTPDKLANREAHEGYGGRAYESTPSLSPYNAVQSSNEAPVSQMNLHIRQNGAGNKYRAGIGRLSGRRAYVDTFNKGSEGGAASMAVLPSVAVPVPSNRGFFRPGSGGVQIFTPNANLMSQGNVNARSVGSSTDINAGDRGDDPHMSRNELMTSNVPSSPVSRHLMEPNVHSDSSRQNMEASNLPRNSMPLETSVPSNQLPFRNVPTNATLRHEGQAMEDNSVPGNSYSYNQQSTTPSAHGTLTGGQSRASHLSHLEASEASVTSSTNYGNIYMNPQPSSTPANNSDSRQRNRAAENRTNSSNYSGKPAQPRMMA